MTSKEGSMVNPKLDGIVWSAVKAKPDAEMFSQIELELSNLALTLIRCRVSCQQHSVGLNEHSKQSYMMQPVMTKAHSVR